MKPGIPRFHRGRYLLITLHHWVLHIAAWLFPHRRMNERKRVVAYVQSHAGRSNHSSRAACAEERDAHRTKTAPCLLCLWTHARRDQPVPSSRALGIAADLSTDLWRELNQARAHAYLLPEMFYEGRG